MTVGFVCAVVIDISNRPVAHQNELKIVIEGAAEAADRANKDTMSHEPILKRFSSGSVRNKAVVPAVKEYHDAISEALDEESLETDVDDLMAENPGMVATGFMLEALDGKTDTVEYFQGTATGGSRRCHAVEGDMVGCDTKQLSLLQSRASAGKRWGGQTWPSSDIKFCYMPGTSEMSKRAFYAAIQHVDNMVSCLGFTEIGIGMVEETCESSPAIFVKSNEAGCWSEVGAPVPGREASVLNLDPSGCAHLGIAVHELCHSLGMLHEQSRSDRDMYVAILWMNIQPVYKDQFELREGTGIDPTTLDFSSSYDLSSVMHYDSEAFTISPGQKTLMARANTAAVMGNRMGLTKRDAMQLQEMYGCQTEVNKTCTSDPGVCDVDGCVCRQDKSAPLGIIKVRDGKCKRCLRRCPNFPSYSTNTNCACTRDRFRVESAECGKARYSCKLRSRDSPPLIPKGPTVIPHPSPRNSSANYCPDYPEARADMKCTCPSGKTKGSSDFQGVFYHYCEAAEAQPALVCPNYPNGYNGNCTCDASLRKGSFKSGEALHYFCTAMCPDSPECWQHAACTCDLTRSMVKIRAESNCFHCSRACETYPYGRQGQCECPYPLLKGTFLLANVLYSYCKSNS
eukprot:TRINITY_DN26952_c0_g1_i1.p1 TRINITY_DN26952_c0_g1~~TRINITY_DN26952_c0_g1_i1.p1  ORF type:complete len:668 (+),score=56.60 TRINITY_DN26952_c0_g1_i1:127-2004(+)